MVEGVSGKALDDGSYDLDELKQAREALNGDQMEKDVPKKVDPMYIEANPNKMNIVRSEELGQRVVILDYDEHDNIIGVELL